MRISRAEFKYLLRKCRREEATIRADILASLTGTFLSQIIPDNPLHELQADRTLLSTSAPHPPVASIVEPKYLNVLVHGIG